MLADTNPPTILNVVNLGLTDVQVTYSKKVEAASATNAANYVFTNGLTVTRRGAERRQSNRGAHQPRR